MPDSVETLERLVPIEITSGPSKIDGGAIPLSGRRPICFPFGEELYGIRVKTGGMGSPGRSAGCAGERFARGFFPLVRMTVWGVLKQLPGFRITGSQPGHRALLEQRSWFASFQSCISPRLHIPRRHVFALVASFLRSCGIYSSVCRSPGTVAKCGTFQKTDGCPVWRKVARGDVINNLPQELIDVRAADHFCPHKRSDLGRGDAVLTPMTFTALGQPGNVAADGSDDLVNAFSLGCAGLEDGRVPGGALLLAEGFQALEVAGEGGGLGAV